MTESAAERDLRAIEEALGTIVRQAKSPRQQERIAELGAVSLETSLYPILRRLGEADGTRLTELAEGLGVDISTASRQVRQLEGLDLVRRDRDPEDGRASVLHLTPRGGQAVAGLRRARRQRIAELVDSWSAADRAILARLLTRLAASIVDSADAPTKAASR